MDIYVYDTDFNIVNSPDTEVGSLTQQEIIVTHKYIVDTEEVGHFDVITEYPNGGKDVEWVVDVEEQGHWETRCNDGELFKDYPKPIPDDWPHDQEITDFFSFYLYTPYTDAELEEIAKQKVEMERQAQILELKAKLADTDYIIIKMSEYSISGTEIPEDDAARYAEIIKQREQWRTQINELEGETA